MSQDNIVAEAVVAAKAAAGAADGAREAGAARARANRTGADRFSIVAHDCQRGCAHSGCHALVPHQHSPQRGLYGKHQPAESGWCGRADRSVCQGVWLGVGLRRRQRGSPAVAGQGPPQDQPLASGLHTTAALHPRLGRARSWRLGWSLYGSVRRNLKGWFLPGQVQVAEIVGSWLKKSHSAK